MSQGEPIKVVTRKVADLIPYDRNPKIHPDSQIADLRDNIRRAGLNNPITIDENNRVINGHGRLYAIQQLGWEEVSCSIKANKTEEEKKFIGISDNKIAENATYDNALLHQELKDMGEELREISGANEDFRAMEFQPNTEPSFDYKEVNDDDLAKASDNIHSAFDEQGKDKSEKGKEVICPYCAESFKVVL